jgi:hypothetical protein
LTRVGPLRRLLALGLAAGLAAPAAAQEAVARAAFLGDGGTGSERQRSVRNQLQKWAPPLVFLLGDNVYESGDRRRFAEVFDNIYGAMMGRGTSFHAALGNHDVKYCAAADVNPLPDDRDAYLWRRTNCDVEDQLAHVTFGYYQAKRYYTIVSDATPAPLLQVFVLDSNTLDNSQTKLPLLKQDTAQLQWLESVLGASRATWKVVVMHHPPHSPTTGGRYFFFVPFGEGRAREYKLEVQLGPILRRHGVDAVITGHNHFYARMVPQQGIRYFVSGGGGRSVYPFLASPGYVAAGGPLYHFLYVRATASRFEYYAIDRDGRSQDAGWFAKGDAADHAFPPGTLPPS